jgi:hypothetical protein
MGNACGSDKSVKTDGDIVYNLKDLKIVFVLGLLSALAVRC